MFLRANSKSRSGSRGPGRFCMVDTKPALICRAWNFRPTAAINDNISSNSPGPDWMHGRSSWWTGAKKKIGPLAYLVAGLKALRETKPGITVRADGREFTGELVLI